MGYGIRYRAIFDAVKPLEQYVVDIYKKDYSGEFEAIVLGETPVIQEWQDDDPKAAIRGCTFKVNIITDENGLRLQQFYSEDDNEWMVVFRDNITGVDLFSGFLLQDDCAEILVDYNHEIQLTFTDQLGILKDVTLGAAALNIGTLTTINTIPIDGYSFPNKMYTLDGRIGVLKPGDWFRLYDGVNTYEFLCIDIEYLTSPSIGFVVTVDQNVPFSTLTNFDLTYIVPYNLNGYIPLIDVMRLCLKSTKLDLNFYSLVNIFPLGPSAVERFFEDTFVDAATFYDGNEWMDCYTILENLMSRFNASLFQAYNKWYVIRWDEMYRYTTSLGVTYNGQAYDSDFNYITTINTTENFEFLNGSDFETGVVGSIIRPYQYVKETFKYDQPNDLLKNPNLTELGNFRTEYIDANNDLIKEYDLPYWEDPNLFPGLPQFTRFIRIAYNNDVTSDNFGEEKYRFIVLTGSVTTVPQLTSSCVSNDIYLSQGDSINFSCYAASGYTLTGSADLKVFVEFIGTTNNYYLDLYGYWQILPPGAFYINTFNLQVIHLSSGQDLKDGVNWNMNVIGVPEDGILKISLFNYNSSSSDEMYFRDFSFSVKSFYSGYTAVNGQNHYNIQKINSKNNNQKDIYFDNSPSWYIKGTFFTAEVYNGLRRKTVKWSYPGASYSFQNLGRGMTQELLFTRYKPRTKYEGNLLYVRKGSGPYKFLTPLSVFRQIGELNTYRFIPGKMTIDYKRSACDLTLYEHIDNMGGDFSGGIILEYLLWTYNKFYEFNYLYEN